MFNLYRQHWTTTRIYRLWNKEFLQINNYKSVRKQQPDNIKKQVKYLNSHFTKQEIANKHQKMFNLISNKENMN